MLPALPAGYQNMFDPASWWRCSNTACAYCKIQIPTDRARAWLTATSARRYTSLYLTERHSRSPMTLSRQTLALATMTGLNFFDYAAFSGWLTTYLTDERHFSAATRGHDHRHDHLRRRVYARRADLVDPARTIAPNQDIITVAWGRLAAPAITSASQERYHEQFRPN